MGIDVGTTNIKALVINEHGEVIAFAKRSSPFQNFEGHNAYECHSFWENICQLLKETAARMLERGASPKELRGIAVASMGEMGFPVGKKDAIFPAISWYDLCSVRYWEQLCDRISLERQVKITRQKIIHIFSVAKLMWLKAEHPRIYDEMDTWLCIADYVSFKLCGSRCMEKSLATRTGLLDYRTDTWSDEILKMAGIDSEKLPCLVHGGERLGEVTIQAANDTGLPPGLPVFAGGHDHICASFATGAWDPGTVMASSGTTEVVVKPEPIKANTLEAGEKGFNVGPHVYPHSCYIMGGIPASGVSVDWYQREFHGSSPQRTEIGSLIYLPHLRGSSSPTRDPRSKGAFLGITDRHVNSDFMQAVYEGVAFELKQAIEDMGKDVKKIIGVGGGYQNDRWTQIKADVLQTEIVLPSIKEATALGVALLASIGSGMFPTAEDALRKTFRIEKKFVPNCRHQKYYEEKYRVFQSLYGTLLDINKGLSALNAY